MRWLIIEDDPDANQILAEMCRDRKGEPIQCFTGEHGLKVARNDKPDLVFLDLMLPDIDGYSICESLKLDRETNPIPVVMVTALTSEENRLRGFRVGADAYVYKPYRTEDIDQAVESVLSHHHRLVSNEVENHIVFDLSSELAHLRSVNELLGIILRHTPLSEKEITQLHTAFQEMGQNAIEWGNKHDAEKQVKITCTVQTKQIEITIADQGEGFDPQNLPHACQTDDSNDDDDPTKHFAVREMLGLREGGFGMMIARGLVDEIKYNDVGNTVTLIKRFR